MEMSPDAPGPQPSCATGAPSGGALWLAAGGTAAVADTVVAGSAAVVNGGAFAVSAGAKLAVQNVSVSGCLASEDGGVARVDSKGSIEVQDCEWTFNRAKFGGSLISIGPEAAVKLSGLIATSAPPSLMTPSKYECVAPLVLGWLFCELSFFDPDLTSPPHRRRQHG